MADIWSDEYIQWDDIDAKFLIWAVKKPHRVFIICPVREATEEERATLERFVAEREEQGQRVWYPARDTDQKACSLKICRTNSAAMSYADEVAVLYNPASEGSVLDQGVVLALITFMARDKKITLINDIEPTNHKSKGNLWLALAKGEVHA